MKKRFDQVQNKNLNFFQPDSEKSVKRRYTPAID